VILGAVFTDSVIVQRLTDYVWVGLDSTAYESQIDEVARLFYALKTNLERLKMYYEKVQPTGDDLPVSSRYFPSITAYRHGNEIIHFEYVGFLENCPECLTFRARTTNTEPAQDIVVKFVERYGEKAHRVLADENLAPKILFYGSPRLDNEQPTYQSISMIIMEYIEGETLAKAKPTLNNNEATTTVRLELERALKLLHDQGLVFGDLRSTNVMITTTEEKQQQVKLVDFNWAGEEGRTTYPYLMSSEIDWPKGVEALAVIERAHDLEMLNRLFST
jgi:serine/threonine protein kinase